MKYNLLHAMLINEAALQEVTKAEILKLQTYLIDTVEGSEDVDFDVRPHSTYGFAIHLTHKGDECDIVRVSRKTVSGSDFAYGIKVRGKRLRLSYALGTLISDVHDWRWTSMW